MLKSSCPGAARHMPCRAAFGISMISIAAIHLAANRASAGSATQPAALVASTIFPAAGARDVCADTPLRISFSAPPAVGEGKIKVLDASDNSLVQSVDVTAKTATQSIGGLPHYQYYPLIISGNDATIYLSNGSLAYGKSYYVMIDAGAFRNASGPYSGISGRTDWKFSTKAMPPAAGTSKLNVAADGSGDFCTVQGAIDFVPDGNTARTTILLRKGTYIELIYLANKHALTFTGEDRTKSVISYANNAKFNPASDKATYHRGVFLAAGCRDLVINNLTIRDTTPRGGTQAEALILNGNTESKAIIANVDLYSFQDTLQFNCQTYICDSYIEGDVDFMWGKGPCFFENCHCYGTRSKAYYTQIRNPETNHGFVYHRCTFDGPDGVTGMYLSRIAPAVYPHSEVVLMDCVVGSAVSPVAWLLNVSAKSTTAPTAAPDVHFWEYNSHAAAGRPVDVSKRLGVSRQLKSPDDAELIADYSKPSFVLGNDWQAESDPDLPKLIGGR
jgi:pectin methylesterase-like acyl-CoA thioesterase